MGNTDKGNDLGHFLKARRMELTPDDVGLPSPTSSRRRATGLRREEVAALASISPDYYARIEQGRRIAPWPTLDAIARVLCLDDAGREYLLELSTRGESLAPSRRRQKVVPHFQRLLYDLDEVPAIILGRWMDVLAWNSLAAALITDFGALPPNRRNYVYLTFTEPAMRDLYRDWPRSAKLCVAQLRMEVARNPQGDPRLNELVGELSVRDADFRRWWSDHHVAVRSSGVKEFRHPDVGDLTLDWDTLTAASDPDQQLISWSAKPDSPSLERLRALAQRHA